jgi:hypothetical protein
MLTASNLAPKEIDLVQREIQEISDPLEAFGSAVEAGEMTGFEDRDMRAGRLGARPSPLFLQERLKLQPVAQVRNLSASDPVVDSLGEFMKTDDRIRHVLELSDIESIRRTDISRLADPVGAGVDFAAGGDSNVILKKIGNYVPDGCIEAWRERDTRAAIGRYVAHFFELGLEPRCTSKCV